MHEVNKCTSLHAFCVIKYICSSKSTFRIISPANHCCIIQPASSYTYMIALFLTLYTTRACYRCMWRQKPQLYSYMYIYIYGCLYTCLYLLNNILPCMLNKCSNSSVNIAMVLPAGEFVPRLRPLQHLLHGFWSTAPTLSNSYYNSWCACALFYLLDSECLNVQTITIWNGLS